MLKIVSIVIFFLILVLIISSNINYYHGEISDHFNGKRFYDPELRMDRSSSAFFYWILTRRSKPWPEHVEVNSYDVPPSHIDGDELRITNVGHVTFLIQTQGLNILTDPIWSERASPVTFIGPKRVIDPGIKFKDLPPIDIVWISHNHYDHLDLATIQDLWKKFKPRIITPLGNDAIIQAYNKEIVVEAYDWGDSIIVSNEVKLYLSPMQHWSRRGLFDRNKALWAALTIVTKGGNIYFIGDSGYGGGRYFKRDKEKFGGFRLALLPMGAYEPRWFMKYYHMDPEEFVQAHLELGSALSVPSHYDVFKLTDEGRGEASIELKKAMQKYKIGKNIRELRIGEALMIPKTVETISELKS